MTERELQQLLARGADAAELLVPDLRDAYQEQINAAGRAVAKTFGERAVVTASAEWQEPPIEEMLLAALAAMTFVTVTRLRAKIVKATASPVVEAAGGAVDINADAYERLLAALADRGEEVAEGIREPLLRAIRDAYENNDTVPHAAQAIRAAIKEVAPWQANMLARTDLIALNNGASMTGIQQTNHLLRANGQREFGFKRWVTAHDERVRHDHAVASGQTVALDQPFTVGGSFMQFPGDPAGGAAQTWNCRCTLSYQESNSLTASSPPATLPSEATMSGYQFASTVNSTAPTGQVGEVFVKVRPDFSEWPQEMLASTVTINVSDAEETELATKSGWTTDPALALEGVPTEDGRWLAVGSTDWRELPLTLMGQVETADGHDGAQVAGRIDSIWRVENGDTAEIHADGVFDTGEFGADIARMVDDEMLRGVSVDLAILEYGFRDPDSGEIILPEDMTDDDWMRAFMGELQFAVLKSQILGATITPFPAFADARIATVASGQMKLTLSLPLKLRLNDTVTASAAPIAPPREWFEMPEPDELTPMTITKDGQVYGHAGTWNCHEGYLDRCMIAPHSQTNHAYFHTGEIETAEGDLIPIGRWTVRGPHADLNLTRVKAQAHYDDATTCVAFLRAIDGKHGVWTCGTLKSDVTPEQLRDVRANPPSGDWRGGELIAVHSVPVAGLPVPRTMARVLVASSGEQEVASLITAPVCGCEQMSQGEYQIRIEALAELAGLD